MKIVIIGAGKVGYNLAGSLSKENNDVIVIDKNPQALRKCEDNLDVLCIKGSGVSTRVLLEAGIANVNLLIAVTNSDEVNMVCCLTAKKLGAAHTIARIRDPEYAHELSLLKEDLGLDFVINPESLAADEIAQSLSFSSAIDVESFARGRIRMVELKVTPDMPIVGVKLKNLPSIIPAPVLIGAVVRDGEVFIPKGEFELKENDEIYVLGKHSNIYNFCKVTGKSPQKIKNVMILGGGRIAYYLARILGEMGVKVKIIEIDRERCMELSELLPNTLIINGDGTDEEVLLSENIEDMDGFVAVTGMDEENMMSSLMAKNIGVKKIVTKISRTNYVKILKDLGINSVIDPKQLTTNQILKYIRGSHIESLYRIIEGQAEIVEFIANESSHFIDKPLKELKLVDNAIVATIVRKNEIVIPHGNDVIKKGDRVIVITKEKNINKLDDLSKNLSGGIQNELRNGIKKFGDIISM